MVTFSLVCPFSYGILLLNIEIDVIRHTSGKPFERCGFSQTVRTLKT